MDTFRDKLCQNLLPLVGWADPGCEQLWLPVGLISDGGKGVV